MGQSMYRLRDMLCDELDKVTEQGELTPSTLEIVDKLTHSIKSIDTIIAMDEAGYSQDRHMYNDYDGGNSYARGRRGNVKRDSMGRYSRDDYSRVRRGGYSRDDAKHELMEHLDELERSAKDEETRRMVQRWRRQAEED